jgi:hypothetical protein
MQLMAAVLSMAKFDEPKNRHDLSKPEAIAGLIEWASVALATYPKTAALALFLRKVPGLWGRRVNARAGAWYAGFLRTCQRERLTPFEMVQRVAEQIESGEAPADVVFGFVKDVMATPFEGCVPILGALRGAYYAEGRATDAFFRSFAALLAQCTELDLEGLRTLIGRLACVQPDTKSKTLLLETVYFHNAASDTGSWRRDVHQLELEVDGGSRRTNVLGTSWTAAAQWRRIDHLLVSTGLARGEGRENLIVQHGEVLRMQKFLRPAIEPAGRYRYVLHGSGGSYHAELELIPACFGYGATPDEAVDLLRKNLVMFVSDAATAVLAKP